MIKQRVNENDIQIIVKNFTIENITGFQIVRNHSKILVKLDTANEETYYLKGEQRKRETVERTCHYASMLHSHLPVTSYIKTKTNHYTVDYENFIFTIEKGMQGQEIDQLTDLHLASMAKALAIQHVISLQNGFTIGAGTSWGMFGGNETEELGHYDENELSFWKFKEAFSNTSLYDQIEHHYLQKRNQLKALWPLLPSCAIQGDLCYYNMLFKEDGSLAAIFDFNIAGDEICVNEVVAVAIYCCWHLDYQGEKSPIDRYHFFMENYRSIRAFTLEEHQAEKWLFPIIRAFRYDRIEDGIANTNAHNEFVAETFAILQS